MKKILLLTLFLFVVISSAVQANIEVKEPVIIQQPVGGVYRLGDNAVLVAQAESVDGGIITYQWYCTEVNDISTIRALYNKEDETYGKSETFEPIQELGTKYYCYMAQNTITRDDESATAFLYSELTPITFEKPFVIEVSVEIDEPVVGEVLSNNAKPLKDGYTITGVHWTPDDEVFKEDTEYTVSFDIKIDDGRSLRSDYFGIVNGNEAEMPYEYNEQEFLKYTFPKTEIIIVEEEPEIVEEKSNEVVVESKDSRQPTTGFTEDNKMELLTYVLIGIISFVVLIVIIRVIKSLFNR